MIIEIPWPPRGLSPNARIHHMARAALVSAYRKECAILLMYHTSPKERQYAREKVALTLDVTFWHPTARKPDTDNMLASIKAGIDGVCQALHIDDGKFRRISLEVGGKRTGGAVILEIA